ncbi:MAG TPA: Uma2 family endonuclease [Thermoanaerobaculia bacterium]|nr:Uma2 family endonuclease [Thermoanaerobaculia bacterium]
MPKMDENRAPYHVKAPGSSGSSVHLPGRGSFPRVDDHLVVPELTRDEIIGGRRIEASPAHPPHATRHHKLDYVIGALVAPGYQAATDLLTRHDQDSDFASDVCIFKDGVDPATSTRYLEEIAFEVVSEQNERYVAEKALRMYRRGVRRIFTIWIKGRRVCEWSPESQSWRPLDAGSQIEDPCLVTPLAVAALLDAVAADKAVVEALDAKDNPALRQREATAEARGRTKGVAESILKVLETRGLAVSERQREEILGCQDPDRLGRWLSRAVRASSMDEILSES